jgi:serine-type D-Ala-D-Ala carboxypeptidase/endopeptidase (penicillin-binding protein 4)
MSGRSYPWAGKTVRDAAPAHALDELAQQVAARGVRVVAGDVVGDDTLFAWERYGEGWGWDDLQWEYGAGVSALSVADNVRYLTVHPGAKAGEPATAEWDDVFVPEPVTDAVSEGGPGTASLVPGELLAVSALTGAVGSEAHLGMSREVDGGPLRIFGVLPAAGKPVHLAVSVRDPALFAAMALKAALERAGVEVRGQARAEHRPSVDTQGFKAESRVPVSLPAASPVALPAAKASGGGAVLAERKSPALSDVVTVTNKVSQNLHAELLLRELGHVYGSDGNVAQGVRVVRQFAINAGVDGEDLSFVDGSGLSPEDLVTPRAVTTLLVWAGRQSWGPLWKASLPVGGVDGSLAGRFTEAAMKGRVEAKTGTLGEVNALSGYVTAASGRVVAFSILVNDAQHADAVRKAMDDVVRAVAAAY